MNINDMLTALSDAENTLSIADKMVSKFARFLIGRLRKVESTYTLRLLKRELADFNSNTREWKS